MSNQSLVEELISHGYLKSKRIIKAFQKIDRKEFVLKEYQSQAYLDTPLPIGYGQTISQPLVVAFMLELLQVKPGNKVLDIGAGSGWVTALLASLVGEKGRVIAIERIFELVKMATNNVSKFNFIEKGIVKIVSGDGSKGYISESPFDRIICGADARVIPESWKNQLEVGGRLVTPSRDSIVVLDKVAKDKFEQRSFWGFSFVPLIQD